MTKRKTKLWTKILFLSVFILFLLGIIGETITIGEKLGRVNQYLEYIYYALIGIIIVFGVIYPVFAVFTAPIFSLKNLRYADGRAKKKWCKRMVNNLLNNLELSSEERDEIKSFLNYDDLLDDKIIAFFNEKIVPQINEEVYDTAKKILVITSLSQNSLYDTLGMASANFCMVRRIVEICGFRPTTPQVIGLYLKIISYSFVTGALEDMDVEEIFTFATETSVGKIGGVLLSSVTQGAVNALMTLRIAMITKNYLINSDVRQTKKELRKKSFLEAAELLKKILSNSFETHISEPVKNFFVKKPRMTKEQYGLFKDKKI